MGIRKKVKKEEGEKIKTSDDEVVKEFGGPIGAAFVMIISHIIVYYLWICITFYEGKLAYPNNFNDFVPFFGRMWEHVVERAYPTAYACKIYLGFILFQAVLAVSMPGVKAKGLPVPSEGNKQLIYNCNGVASWYVSLVVILVLHFTDYFRLSVIFDHLGEIMTVSVIFANVLSVLAYVSAIALGKAHRMSGNHVYDFFMGAWLNPRFGTFDLKFWAETRVAWIVLFFLTLSAALTRLEEYGSIGLPLIFMLFAHGLYTNAVMKGEECIPPTWDIFYEKWGWMLIFWNFSGVPFVYCANSFFLTQQNSSLQVPTWFVCVLFVVLFGAYYIWDTSQSQKSRFRLKLKNAYIPRSTFPQLPWGTLENPEYMETKAGSKLLVDGWWRYARKIHYTTDIMMAWSWGLICGFSSPLPYFYGFFFTCMIFHRYTRDVERCARKYGDDWKKYTEKVPYAFIPYVF